MNNVFGRVPGRSDRQIFTAPSTVTNLQWQTWRKPVNCGMAEILCIGGGACGNQGGAGAASSARGGGGGGGSSAMTRVIMPIFLLPDVLYVQVGSGGVPVARSGVLSYVSVFPNTTANNVIAVSGAAPPTGGGAGGPGGGGAGGVAGTIAVIGSMLLAGLGQYSMIAGQAGANGGTPSGANGTNITIPATGLVMTGGVGGAGTTSADFAGGTFNSVSGTLINQMIPAAPAAGALQDGSGGPQLWAPLFSFGGCGGSSSNTGTGGNGGNGAYGSGGGGSGAGVAAGNSGFGGGGIVLITSW